MYARRARRFLVFGSVRRQLHGVRTIESAKVGMALRHDEDTGQAGAAE